MWNLIGIIFVIAIIVYLFIAVLPLLAIGGAIILLIYAVLNIMKNRYFKSDQFLEQKSKVDSMIMEYNEISEYVKNIPNETQFVSSDTKNEYSHLAKSVNTSSHNYKRDKNKKTLNDDFVYSTSLNIVKRASEEPIKYLCKYFGINPTEEDLQQLEKIGENMSRVQHTLDNLEKRKNKIVNDFEPPKYIVKFFEKELYDQLHMDIPEISVDYTTYIFEYVSPGGNSSQKTEIKFDEKTVEATAKYIAQKIKYKNSAKAQRALMTERLRNQIKERDDFTCQICGASIYEQDLLLLEVDHILPVSKGGMSTPDNLQTLCWKCNRTKGAKVI